MLQSGQLEDENSLSAFEAWELICGVGKGAKCLGSAHRVILILAWIFLFFTAQVITLHLIHSEWDGEILGVRAGVGISEPTFVIFVN